MKWLISIMVFTAAVMVLSNTAPAGEDGPAAWWKFEKLVEQKIVRPFEEEDEAEELEADLRHLMREAEELQEQMEVAAEEDMEELEGEMRRLRSEMRELREELEELEEEEEDEDEEDVEGLEEELRELRREMEGLKEEMEQAEGEEKEELQEEMRELRNEMRGLQEEIEELEEEEEDEEGELEGNIEWIGEELESIAAAMKELAKEIDKATGEERKELREEMKALQAEDNELRTDMKKVRARLEELREEEEEEEEEFEVIMVRSVVDEVSGVKDRVEGAYFKIVAGVSGNAIKLDGNTSYIVRDRDAADAPEVCGELSVEAWVALAAYPTNWCPVVDHSTLGEAGYFLGIDALGHAGFKIYADGKRYEIESEQRIPLRKWAHIAGVYTPEDGISLYLDGKRVASKDVTGEFTGAKNRDLLIGKHSIERQPYGTLRPNATAAVYTFYDGLIDELKIYNRGLSADEISKYVAKSKPKTEPALTARSLPSGPPGKGRFGAYYTTLKYYDGWDAPWRVGGHADVVVRFDESACRFVFWRGTSYIPHWVTEDNEFNETWSEKGCHEPMSDKQCRFSHVRIIESSDARAVVHWRYALVDNWYHLAKVDDLTGWGDWTDEVYTIYPDMVAVRKVTLHSSEPAAPHEWHEGIIVMGPGQRPEEVLHPDALTLANMKGETHTYSWEHGVPPEADEEGVVELPKNANIHWVNTKSEYKPFVAVSPDSDPVWDIYAHELRRDISMFPWWNHWPTAQKPSDGRYAWDSDLASHSSLSHCHWKPYSQTEDSMTKIMLNGLTAKSAARLVPLAKSWSRPPALKLKKGLFGSDFESEGYDPTERAYQIVCKKRGKPSVLEFELAGSKKSPVVNPAFVIKGWGDKGAILTLKDRTKKAGKSFRVGHRHTVDGSDLIVWIKAESTKPVKVKLTPAAL
jgi:predicted  nucleic acid-binding Zn-ribbon protein